MRRDIRGKKGNENGYSKKIFYITGSIIAVAVIVAIGIIVFAKPKEDDVKIGQLGLSNNGINEIRNSIVEQASSQIGKTIQEVEKQNAITNETVQQNEIVENKITNGASTENITISKENKESVEKQEETTTQNKEKQEQNEENNKQPDFALPVEGEILKEYAKEKLVYSNTLKEWITHTGIDLKAEKTTVVKSAADGKVKSIKNDPRYGLTVVIEHSAGYSSVYANLLTAEFVVVGENVKQGQTIGTVGNTATFEIADEPHLHFEILKDNVQVDPSLYM